MLRPFGVSLMAARGHDEHEFLLHVAKQLEELLVVGYRRNRMRDSVNHRLVLLEKF